MEHENESQQPIEPDLSAEFDALEKEAGTPTGDGAPSADAGPDIPTKDALSLFLSPLCEVIFPAWNVQPAEIALLADAYAPVIDKYFPDGFGIEVQALVATAIVFGPRLRMPRKQPNTEKEAKPDTTKRAVLKMPEARE